MRWIDESKEKPPMGKRVLVCGSNGNITDVVVGHLTDRGWVHDWGITKGEIKYWMTCPQPPSGIK